MFIMLATSPFDKGLQPLVPLANVRRLRRARHSLSNGDKLCSLSNRDKLCIGLASYQQIVGHVLILRTHA